MERLLITFSTVFFICFYVHSESIREWWISCNGNDPNGTCLTDAELSKFKTLCSNGNYKKDCQKVVDYVVARTRLFEARSFLISGHTSQMNYFAGNQKYLYDVEKIWDQNSINSVFSFALGVLPGCDLSGKNKLLFSKNLRSEVREYQDDILSIYGTLSSKICPDAKDGFVLVAIGKITTLKNEFEIFTIDENKNIKVLRSSLGSDPFAVR